MLNTKLTFNSLAVIAIASVSLSSFSVHQPSWFLCLLKTPRLIPFAFSLKLLDEVTAYSHVSEFSCSVVFDSLWPHGLYPIKLLCPWDLIGKNTGVGYHLLLLTSHQITIVAPCLIHIMNLLLKMMKPSIYHPSWILVHFQMHEHLNSSEFLLLILWPRVLPSPFVLLSWIRKDSVSTAFSIVTSNNFSLLKASTKFLTMKTRSAARTSLGWVIYILLPVSHHPLRFSPYLWNSIKLHWSHSDVTLNIL